MHTGSSGREIGSMEKIGGASAHKDTSALCLALLPTRKAGRAPQIVRRARVLVPWKHIAAAPAITHTHGCPIEPCASSHCS